VLGMAGFAVRIDDLRAAAAAFARLRVDAEGLLAANGLGDSAGMAGRDPVLAAWRTRYDAVAAAEWAAATTAVATLGAIATKLAGTADSYLAAEHDATGRLSTQPKGAAGGAKDRPGPPAQPPFGRDGTGPPPPAGAGGPGGPAGGNGPLSDAGGPRGVSAGGGGPLPSSGAGRTGGPTGSASSSGTGAGGSNGPTSPDGSPHGTGPSGQREPAGGPPSSTGAGGPEVPDALAAYYPGGEPERLRAAGARWVALAEGMSRVAGAGDDTFRRLAATGDGIAFSAMRTFWAERFTQCATDPLFNAVVTGAGVLGDSCRELADLIEHTRAAVRGAAAEAVADMEPLELPARLLGKLAWNVPELELLVGMGALAVAYLDHYRDAYLFSLDRLVERLSLADEQRLRRAAAPDPPIAAALADVGRVAGLGLTGTAWDTAAGPHPTPDAIHVTPQRATHILHSDDTGGGHAPGTGRPGQSEFPRGWSDQRILTATLAVAQAPEVLRRGRYGRWVAEGVEDGVRIRVVVGADGYVFTSVPLSGPGVVRNPGAR
jgi:hypothetical protein